MERRNFISIFLIILIVLVIIGSLDYEDGNFRITGFALPNLIGTCPCKEGIGPGECDSTLKPFYCEKIGEECSLIKNCGLCGCPDGMNCNEYSGTCNAPEEKCDDGTPYRVCSVDRPYYCTFEGEIIKNCEKCGCSLGYNCVEDGSCLIRVSINPEERNIDDVVKLLNFGIKPKERESIEYVDYVFDFDQTELSLVKLMAPIIRDIKLGKKPEIIVEEISEEEIKMSPPLEGFSEEYPPEKIIKVSGIPPIPVGEIRLSPPKPEFQFLLAQVKNKPHIGLNLFGIS